MSRRPGFRHPGGRRSRHWGTTIRSNIERRSRRAGNLWRSAGRAPDGVIRMSTWVSVGRLQKRAMPTESVSMCASCAREAIPSAARKNCCHRAVRGTRGTGFPAPSMNRAANKLVLPYEQTATIAARGPGSRTVIRTVSRVCTVTSCSSGVMPSTSVRGWRIRKA